MIIFDPLPGKVVCELLANQLETGAGIILLRDPGTSRIAKVIAAYEPFRYPEEEEVTEPAVKKGDYVIFGKHSGTEITVSFDGHRKQAIVLKETEILTKVRVSSPTSQEEET